MLTKRLCYSLRTLLIFVTLVALGCWLYVRQREFSSRANKHVMSSLNLTFASFPLICKDSLGRSAAEHLRQYELIRMAFQEESKVHRALWKKYQRAAKYPWLPVKSDPPGVKFYEDIQAVMVEHKIVFGPPVDRADSSPRH